VEPKYTQSIERVYSHITESFPKFHLIVKGLIINIQCNNNIIAQSAAFTSKTEHDIKLRQKTLPIRESLQKFYSTIKGLITK